MKVHVHPRSIQIVAIFVAFALLGLGEIFAQEKGAFYLKDGDRIVFYGDSITDQRHYTMFTESYIVTRFPKMNITFTHSGWGGDRVSGGGGGPIDKRLPRDVYAYKPTVMTIMLGMNDGRYRAFDQGIFDEYANGYRHIMKSVLSAIPHIRMTLIQPSPYDDVNWPPQFAGGYNGTLIKYGEFVKKLAEENRQNIADLNSPVVAMLQKAKQIDAELAKKLVPDRVHPRPGGGLIMAESLLKSWNAPAIVSEVEIDAKSGKIQAHQAAVSDLKKGDSLSWKQLDEALPFPLDMGNPEIALAVKASNFVDSLNQQILKFTSLDGNSYILKIDGNQIGTFTKQQLEKGLNLATLNTPMLLQSLEVHKLTIKHCDKHNMRWRGVQMSFEGETLTPKVQEALNVVLEAMDVQDAAIIKQQREMAQPKPHQFELIPLSASAINLAAGKSYVSSDPNKFGWDPGLTDGSWVPGQKTTFATGNTDSFPKHVTIDLGSEIALTKVVAGVPPFGSTKTVEVSLSTDGSGFKPVGEYAFSQKKEERHEYAFSETKARYIRLTYKDHYNEQAGYPNTFSFTSEVEAYGGGSGSAVSPSAPVTPAATTSSSSSAGNLAAGKSFVSSHPNTSGWNNALTDGNWKPGKGSTFASDNTPTFPKHVTIDLEKSNKLGKVVVGVPPYGSTKTIVVSLSEDGANFKEVGSYAFSLSKEERHEYTFPATSARYIRLTYADHYDEKVQFPAEYAFTTEVEAYAP